LPRSKTISDALRNNHGAQFDLLGISGAVNNGELTAENAAQGHWRKWIQVNCGPHFPTSCFFNVP
jgi:hypothetical protein